MRDGPWKRRGARHRELLVDMRSSMSLRGGSKKRPTKQSLPDADDGRLLRFARNDVLKGDSKSPSAGFTLLGVLIAALFMVLVAGALASAAQHTGRAQRAARDRFTATLLAREGIELVRAIRDNNWLSTARCSTVPCTIPWRGTGEPPGDRNSLCSASHSAFIIDPDNFYLFPVGPGGENTRLRLDGNRFRHVGGNLTEFRRWIEITPETRERCDRSASVFVPNTPSDPRNRQPSSFSVRVIVAWEDMRSDPTCRPGRRCVALQEELYPWMNFR